MIEGNGFHGVAALQGGGQHVGNLFGILLIHVDGNHAILAGDDLDGFGISGPLDRELNAADHDAANHGVVGHGGFGLILVHHTEIALGVGQIIVGCFGENKAGAQQGDGCDQGNQFLHDRCSFALISQG